MFSISLGVRRQLIVAFTCSLVAVTTGCLIGWPAPTLKKLQQPDSPLHLTSYQEGWVVSAAFVGQTLCPFPSVFLMRKIGPKHSLLILSTLSIASWILIYFGTNALMYAAAQFLGGLWFGATQTLFPIYMAEISEPHIRGIFGPLYLMGIGLGSNCMYIIAPWVTIPTMAIITGAFVALSLILFSFCPESPYFYVLKRDGQSAVKSLSWLRGETSLQTELELQLIQMYVDAEANGNYLQKLVALMTVPANRKAFTIVAIINIVDGLSGIYCIGAFISVILPEHLGPLTPEYCTIIYGLFNTFSSLLLPCTGLTEKVGHKPLLRASGLGMCVSMAWTSLWYFLTFKTSVDVSHLNWLPLVGFLVFGFFYMTGLGPISIITKGEMFPSHLKEQATALTTMINAFSVAAATAMFPVFTENVGLYMNFLVFAVVAFLNFLFAHFYLIETAGKSLQTIQAELNGKTMDRSKAVRESTRLLS